MKHAILTAFVFALTACSTVSAPTGEARKTSSAAANCQRDDAGNCQEGANAFVLESIPRER